MSRDEMFSQMIENYRQKNHEFDAKSLNLIRDVFNLAFELGVEQGHIDELKYQFENQNAEKHEKTESA